MHWKSAGDQVKNNKKIFATSTYKYAQREQAHNESRVDVGQRAARKIVFAMVCCKPVSCAGEIAQGLQDVLSNSNGQPTLDGNEVNQLIDAALVKRPMAARDAVNIVSTTRHGTAVHRNMHTQRMCGRHGFEAFTSQAARGKQYSHKCVRGTIGSYEQPEKNWTFTYLCSYLLAFLPSTYLLS